MRAKEYLKRYIEPYNEGIEHLEQERARFGGLYNIINDPAFVEVITWIHKLRKEGSEKLEVDSDKSILTIWLHLKDIWQAKEKIRVADDFLAFIESIPQRLQEVTEELQRLTKP